MSNFLPGMGFPMSLKNLLTVLEEIQTCSVDTLLDLPHLTGLIGRAGLSARVLPDPSWYGADVKYLTPVGGMLQVPRQLAELLIYLHDKHIKTGLIIGTGTGFTDCILTAYLQRFEPVFHAITVDPFQIEAENVGSEWGAIKSSVPLLFVDTYPQNRVYSMCFIDGEHDEQHVRSDYENYGVYCQYCAFHDINNAFYPHIGAIYRGYCVGKEHHEFTYHSHNERFMGIGLINLL